MYKSQQVANTIKNIAKEKNISISKLLVDCELNKNALYTMQNRGTMPNADTLIKIADYFNCSIDYLVGRVDTLNEQSLVEAYRQLNEEGQEKASEYISDLVATGRYIKNNKYKTDIKKQA